MRPLPDGRHRPALSTFSHRPVSSAFSKRRGRFFSPSTDHVFEEEEGQLVLRSGGSRTVAHRSSDGGHTWSDPIPCVDDWASEGGIALTPAGTLLAALRYQRPTLPADPPDLERRTGSSAPGWPYKHIALVESADRGRTWKNFRQLTTVFGQTMGRPVARPDGTVLVVHDTRYGPGPPGSRALLSRDHGRTWEDEVYYLDYTTFTGSYNASAALENGDILTLTASSQAGNSWEAVRHDTDVYAIRWRPEVCRRCGPSTTSPPPTSPLTAAGATAP